MAHIVLVEDNPHNRAVFQAALSKSGHQVETAEDGEQALQVLNANAPDLVLLDLSMPGLSGLDTLKQMKQEFPGLPVLMVSVHSEEQYATRVLGAGAAGYLTKEHIPDRLIPAIRQVAAEAEYGNRS